MLKIKIDKITYPYNEKFVLQKIDFSLIKKDVAFIFGDIGVGKTTFINAISGNFLKNAMTVDGYEVTLDNEYILENPSNIAIAYQNSENSFLFDTPDRQLSFLALEQKNSLFEQYKLKHIQHKNINELSVGQKKIISLLSVLYSNASILIFDEPIANLDEQYTKLFFDALIKVKESKYIFIISHEKHIANYCNRFFHLSKNTLNEVQSVLKINVLIDNNLINANNSFSLIKLTNFNYFHKNSLQQFNELNLEIKSNQIYGLLGKNGSGKSTLAKILMDITRGKYKKNKQITIFNKKLKLGIMFQDCKKQLFCNTVKEELNFGLHNNNYTYPLLESEQLLTNEFMQSSPIFLSGGQQRVLLLQSLLLHSFDILILDEPFDNLSASTIINIKNQLLRYQKDTGCTIIICEQNKENITDICTDYIDLENTNINRTINPEYKYIGGGLLHNIYKKDNFVYKIVNGQFLQFNTKEHFELEKYNHNFLRQKGFNVIQVNEISNNYPILTNGAQPYALVENYVNGKVYKGYYASKKITKKVLNFVYKLSQIEHDGYGNLKINGTMHSTWGSFIEDLSNDYSKNSQLTKTQQETIKSYLIKNLIYDKPGKFLLMDPNIENYIFTNKKEFIAIDIDHPTIGDPLYQLACFLYYKPKWKNMIKKQFSCYDKNKIKMYQLLFISYLLEFYKQNKIDYTLIINKFNKIEEDVYNYATRI